MLRWMILLLGVMPFVYATSPEMEKSAKAALLEGARLKKQAHQQVLQFDPKKVFDHYESKPSESNYYAEGRIDTNRMSADSMQAMGSSDTGKTLLKSIHQRPQYSIKTTDPDVERSTMIQSDAEQLVRGMTGRYIGCEAKTTCTPQYITKTCTATTVRDRMSCEKRLTVHAMQPQDAYQTIGVRIQATPMQLPNTVVMKFNLASEKLLAHKGKIHQFGISPALPKSPCPALTLEPIGMVNDSGYPVTLTITEPPTCLNQLDMAIKLSRRNWSDQPMQVTIQYRYPIAQDPVIQEAWGEGCTYLDELVTQGICKYEQKDQCTAANLTKTINGVSITRPCWVMKSHYLCKGNAALNSCDSSSLQGCTQIGSECIDKKGDYCMTYQQRYRCAENSCVNRGDVRCGDGKAYCLDGSCTDHGYEPSQDFGKAVLSLSATNEAAHSFNANFIFKGTAMRCRYDAAHFSNCCKESGWGRDIGLAHCSDEEKALGTNREKTLAIKVGRFCSRSVLGVCVERKESYCVFPSKMARVIQEQGRRGQLRIGFGSGKHPDCRGLSPLELQKLDLSKIDFGAVLMDEMSKKMKPVHLQELQQAVRQHIEQYQRAGSAHEA